jgi:hypothetical protein
MVGLVAALRYIIVVYVPTAQTVIAQGIALGMQCTNAHLPQRGNMIDAYVRPVGAWRFRWDVCTQGVALGYHRLPRWGIVAASVGALRAESVGLTPLALRHYYVFTIRARCCSLPLAP